LAILDGDDLSRSQLEEASRLIQKVANYGGRYKSYIESLYSSWDDAIAVSDSASEIGISGEQWSAIMCEVAEIKKLNLAHSERVNSTEFRLHLSKYERDKHLAEHKQAIKDRRSLLGRLLVLNNNDLNADVNADVDDYLESSSLGKRAVRRLRKAYYIALAKHCLSTYAGDPLEVFGSDAESVLTSIQSIP